MNPGARTKPGTDKVTVASDHHVNNGMPNQDSALLYHGDGLAAFIAVFDGHGIHGDQISGALSESTAESPVLKAWMDSPQIPLRELLGSILDAFVHISTGANAEESGSTMLLATYTPSNSECTVAYCGDTQLAVIFPGSRCECTGLHRLSNTNEVARIRQHLNAEGIDAERVIDTEAGYLVHPNLRTSTGDPRLCNNTRTLGDADFTTLGVIDTPDVVTIDVKGALALVAASDGLWDYVSKVDCAGLVQQYCSGDSKGAECARLITDGLLDLVEQNQHGFPDDVTIVVVVL